MKLFVYHFGQDDPGKCTALRLIRLGLAKRVLKLSHFAVQPILLNPLSSKILTSDMRSLVQRHGLLVLDCSWNKFESVFDRFSYGWNARLPGLLAGNPTHFGVLGRLSTAEAFAAALYIIGFKAEAAKILDCFKWGPTFLALNKELLDEYASLRGEKRIREIEKGLITLRAENG